MSVGVELTNGQSRARYLSKPQMFMPPVRLWVAFAERTAGELPTRAPSLNLEEGARSRMRVRRKLNSRPVSLQVVDSVSRLASMTCLSAQ